MPKESKPLTQFRALPGPGAIDPEAGLIKGVSVMTIGPALGHGMVIDRKGLEQCFSACQSCGDDGVSLIIRHSDENGVELKDIVGAVKNFRIDGEQLLGDAYLLDSAPERTRILEMAAKLPKNFGLSVETTGEHEAVPNSKQKLYRCDGIDAIALVPKPAANKTGIFSEVDKPQSSMDPEEIKNAIVEGVAAAVEPIKDELSKLGDRLSKLEEPEKKDDEPKTDEEKLEKLAAKAAEEGAEKALTRFASQIGVKRAPKADDNHNSHRKLTRFEAKVEELTKLGVRNPNAVAVHKHPDLYEEYRIGLEKGGN